VTFGHNPPMPSPFPSRATERKERDDRARVPGPVSATAPGNTRALFRSTRGKELGLWPETWIFVGRPGFVIAPDPIQNLTLPANLNLLFLPNSPTSFSYDWLPKFVLNVRKRARFVLNVPDCCRRQLLAQRIRGWWTPIVDDRERKGSRFFVPNASIGEYASIDSLRLHISSHVIAFTKGIERFLNSHLNLDEM
jgi:hypothetical protein